MANISKIFKKPVIAIAVILIISALGIILLNSPPDDSEKVVDIKHPPTGNSDTLVVMLHAYTLDGENLASVRQVVESTCEFAGADFLIPNLPFGTFSMADTSKVTHEIVQAIDEAWDKKNYGRIVLIGHSMGALFARKIYVLASGQNKDTKFEEKLFELSQDYKHSYERPRQWAKNVDKIVLLAGMNSGWTISHHMSIIRMITMKIGSAFGHIMEWYYGQPPIIFSIRNGSAFITQLRLQWISMKEHVSEKSLGDALTVQLLGTVDDLVPPTDNIDLVTGADFQYLEVPYSGHSNIIEMSDEGHGVERSKNLKLALNMKNRIEQKTVTEPVSDLIFVIHGIRDEGYWTEKIANRVKSVAELEKKVVVTINSSYGYFPMLGFLRPGERDDKVQWFMNRYTESRAKYPDAKFHFVGHSHGTYILAKALDKYDSVKFENIFFAGSVVHKDYPWKKYVTQERVEKVYNFTATSDWVVAYFPNALQILGIQDLGSAGHDGFSAEESIEENLHNLTYIVGGHSAGIQEVMWDSIAKFIITGNFVKPPAEFISKGKGWFFSFTSKLAPLIWVMGIGILSFGLYVLLTLPTREWKKTLFITVYIACIWTVLTEL